MPKSNPKPRSLAAAPQEVRIIGGQWKRTPLPVADVPGLRPTPSRVRETLFNWLGQNLQGWRCMDAFAGTGALGFEAASRGASEVVLIEQHPELVNNLKRLATRLQATQMRVERGDALAALAQRAGQQWDLVFLDPPFAQGENDPLFRQALAAARAAVHPERGLVYLESPRAWTEADLRPLGWVTLRHGQAGVVHHALLQAGPPG
jgi:16S rRNA (guanine966-N2)-methyltransferase